MKRGAILGAVLALGTLSIGVTALRAQQQQRVITVDKVKDNLFVLRGGGGNTAVFVTTDGVVVVDAKNPGWGAPILEEVKKLTPKPVSMIINTHTHGDHVSGNVEFPASVDVVTHENTKVNMEKLDIFKQHNNQGMAKRTFKDRMTIGKGADQIDLYYFGPGHTNGDAWVVFTALSTVHAGDIFASKGLPLVDGANGGSVLQYPATLNKAYAGIKGVDTIINGHAATTTPWADLKVFAEFNQDFLTWAQGELKAGKSPEEAAKGWTLPEKYTGYSGQVSANFGGLAGRLSLLAQEMKK